MNTIAEWKSQFQIGTQIKQIWNSREGEVSKVLTVTKLQSNGIFGTWEGHSDRVWMSFPKRFEIDFTENGWSRIASSLKIAEYVWIKIEEKYGK
jgi:hypothetical protein